MISEVELISILKKNNISCYKASIIDDENTKIAFDDLDSYLDFIKSQNMNCIFYEYIYPNKDNFIIDIENIEDYNLTVDRDNLYSETYDSSTVKYLFEKFVTHNRSLEKIDFSRPIFLSLYSIYQGTIIFLDIDDNWISDNNIVTAQEKITEIINHNCDFLDNMRSDKKRKLKARRDELRDKILNDSNFHVCTNKELRREYMHQVRRGHKEYDEFLIHDCVNANKFIEEIWHEYKTTKK